MKKSIATLLSCAIAISASALINGDGYYRDDGTGWCVPGYTTKAS